MNILKATKRTSVTTGQVNKLRSDGFIPAVLYGGGANNLNISLKKLHLQNLINTENFMSKVFDLEIDGNAEKVLPRDISYDPVSDDPIHIDFMRITKGSKLTIEIPVTFINSDKSPGLKKGGVLNIVRRKVELKCPAENIPNEIIVDLNNTEINSSLKISSVKLPENVFPTITDRDFTIATIAPPTILVEPEKTEEVLEEGDAPVEDAPEGDAKEGSVAAEGKTTKPSEDKGKATKPSGDKVKSENKETKKK